MEQNIQQIVGNKLPIKTKIAAWWVLSLGILISAAAIFLLVTGYIQTLKSYEPWVLAIGFVMALLSTPLILLPILVLKNKKKAWLFNIIYLALFLVVSKSMYMERDPGFYIMLLLLSIPLILFLIDIRNFWKTKL